MFNLMKDDFYKPEILNIFTDASIKNRPNGKFSGCYGATAVVCDTIIEEMCRVNTDTTNNNSEIKGIRAGVHLALKYRCNYQTINIFSDSQISVFGLRDRIFNWCLKDGVLINKSKEPVKSQEVYYEIIHMILINQLHINLYHQKGHVDNNYNSLQDAEHVFRSSNSIRYTIDLNFIRYISAWNNYIDCATRNMLLTYDKSMEYYDAIHYQPFIFNKAAYKQLIGKKV